MAERKNKQENYLLPLSTKIEVVGIKVDKVVKKIMTFEESFNIVKKPGWLYYNYQIGVCSIKET